MMESGYPQIAFNPDAWLAILAPAGTPTAIIEQLHATIHESLKSPDLLAGNFPNRLRRNASIQARACRFSQAEAGKWPPI